MSEIRPRITGTEMEWGLSTPGELPSTSEQKAREQTYSELMKGYISSIPHVGGSGAFLGNGARFYIDSGSHPEYATPEDTTFLGTVANEMAGERIMLNTLRKPQNTEADAQQEVPAYEFSLHKRLIDVVGNTWGHHENYCADASIRKLFSRPDQLKKRLGILGIHLATRNIFFGAGLMLRGGQYRISQKTEQIQTDFDIGTTREIKPLVNLRDQPEANDEHYFRLHVTSGDANMSPWAMRMKLGSTSLVLRMLEEGTEIPELQPASSFYKIARSVSDDLFQQNLYRMENGGALTGLDIQQHLVQAAGKLASRVTLPAEDLWTLDEWQRACHDMRRDIFRMDDRVDWVAKLAMLQRAQERYGLAWDDPKMTGLDRHWDRMDIHGAGIAFRETKFSKWMPPESLIKERIHSAPTTTRAHLRGKFIKAHSGHLRASVNWMRVQFTPHCVELHDPYCNVHDGIDRLVNIAA